MRTTRQLMEELAQRAQSGQYQHVVLVVAFERTSQPVLPGQLQQLNSLVSQGGEPVGFVGIGATAGVGRIAIDPVEEYKDDKAVNDFLHTFAAQIVAQMETAGLIEPRPKN